MGQSDVSGWPILDGSTRGAESEEGTISSIVWLRRDLRRADLPLLAAAHDAVGEGGEVVVAFVLDPLSELVGLPVVVSGRARQPDPPRGHRVRPSLRDPRPRG